MKENQPSATRVKICGIRQLADALVAAENGASFLGYVFHEKSPRNLEPLLAAEIISEVRMQFPAVRHVGVFANERIEQLLRIIRMAGLDIAQLHGEEAPDYCGRTRAECGAVIKAIRIGADAPEVKWEDFPADFFLCDTFSPSQAGGLGEAFDHTLLPSSLPMDRVFIAGGLTAENVAKVIKDLRPFCVDVSSGVESSRGVKSRELIRQFLLAAHTRS